MTITFTNAVVEDDGYGVEVNGRSLEAIISTALGTRLGDKGGYSSGLPKFKANSCDVTVTITPHPTEWANARACDGRWNMLDMQKVIAGLNRILQEVQDEKKEN